jgi:hypothetical protein
MAVIDDLNAKLRALRDRLAVEAQRAQGVPGTPPDLVRRLQAALGCANGVCLLTSGGTAGAVVSESRVVVTARANALIQGHLALSDWERWIERADRQSWPTASFPENRRRHPRYETDVPVRLVRPIGDGGLAERPLPSDEAVRSAKNVSVGGILVAAAQNDLPRVGVSSVVHVTIELGNGRSLRAGAYVMRRDERGLGLRWIDDSDRVTRAIESLVAAVRGSIVER